MSITACDEQTRGAVIAATPEFADHKAARALFGLSRPHLYRLASDGKIRSVSLRKPGMVRGKRLFDCASIRRFLEANIVAPTAPTRTEVSE